MKCELLHGKEASRTAIFGGTFDPPHEGHVAIVKAVLALHRFDRLVLAVTAQNPFKERKATAHEIRREMLDLVMRSEGLSVTDNPRGAGVYISPLPYIYTAEFVRDWRSRFSDEPTWVIGEDLRDEVGTWKDWDSLDLPLLVVEEIPRFRSTVVRDGEMPPHPAIVQLIADKKLYR